MRWLICLVGCACLAYLAGSPATALSLSLFAIGLWLPLVILLSRLLLPAAFGAALTPLLASIGAVVALAPLYVLRKWVQPAWVFDCGVSLTLLAVVLSGGSWRRLWAGLRERARRSDATVSLGLLLFFVVGFLGYAIERPDGVYFDGLYFKDFSNLLSIASTVKASPGLPLAPVVDTGSLGYHWLFFAVPAWACRFAGIQGELGNALVLCNLVCAWLLFAVLSEVTREVAPHLNRGAVARGALATLFASSTFYAYQYLSAGVGLHLPNRNHLLLQLPHSLSTFGNNTFALVLCLMAVLCLRRYQAGAGFSSLLVAAALTAVLPGYSVTLALPLALAIGVVALSGGPRLALRVLPVFAAVGGLGLAVFVGIGLFGYGTGGGGLSFDPDGGAFAARLLPGLLPVSVAVLLGLRYGWHRSARGHLELMGACLLVPSLLMTKGTPTTTVDLSMKIASLYIAAAGPFIAQALDRALRPQRGWQGAALLALFGLGMVNTAAFVGKFIVYRLRPALADSDVIPRDYYDALRFVQGLPDRWLLLDEPSLAYIVTNPALLVAEKRVLVGAGYEHVAFPETDASRDNERLFLRWQDTGHQDAELAAALARRADVLITSAALPETGPWRAEQQFGPLRVYVSATRQAQR